MQKILFNDRYSLTQAVLNGTKTITRRISYELDKLIEDYEQFYEEEFEIIIQTWDSHRQCIKISTPHTISCFKPRYKLGEVVAVAQPYKVLDYGFHGFATNPDRTCGISLGFAQKQAGWSNKMFVSAKFMPHQIQITDIKVERLQDISDEDCLKEGIFMRECMRPFCFVNGTQTEYFHSPREAFASLIDRRGVGCKGLWESNPWAVVYSFKLVK